MKSRSQSQSSNLDEELKIPLENVENNESDNKDQSDPEEKGKTINTLGKPFVFTPFFQLISSTVYQGRILQL